MPPTLVLKHSSRDIQWGTAEGEIALSRIGAGYDSNYKNFIGCMGSLQVHAGAVPVSTTKDEEPNEGAALLECESCVELYCGSDTSKYGRLISCVSKATGVKANVH